MITLTIEEWPSCEMVEATARVEISDPVTPENAQEIALWSGRSADWCITMAGGLRMVRKFANGGNLPTEMFAITQDTFNTLVRFIP